MKKKILMKHTTKTLIFKSLDILPNKIGYSLYHAIQNYYDRVSIDGKIKSSEVTIDKVIAICDDLKIDLKNKTIFEIGSGWYPIMPYFFKYKCLVKKIFTYDINEHYQKKSILNFNAVFSRMYGYDVKVDSGNQYNLPSDISYFPSQNVVKVAIPQADIIFSRYVLSHVNPNDIVEMHKRFQKEYAKGTHIIHFISPSDLRQHGDKSISMQDFLKYSPKEWDKIQTKFDYHNRLRLPQFIEIFESLGYEVVYKSYTSVEPNSVNQKLFQELNLHEDYKKYSEEELTAGNIILVLKV